MSKILLAN